MQVSNRGVVFQCTCHANKIEQIRRFKHRVANALHRAVDGGNRVDFVGYIWTILSRVENSSYITFRNSVFDGDEVPGEYGNGVDMRLRWSDNVVIENNEFFDFWKALDVSSSTDTIVRANDAHSLNMDAFTFHGVDGLLIEGNYLHDFNSDPNGGHRDMIQFWSVTSEMRTQNVIIRGNFLDAGTGSTTQSIFMRNEVVDTGQGSFADYAYLNILIEENEA